MAEKKGADISQSKVKVNITSKNKSSSKKVVYWIIAIILFYTLTSATVSSKIAEVQNTITQKYTAQEPNVVEKVVKTTQYREEKVPFGSPRCELTVYNFTKTDLQSTQYINGSKYGNCTFAVYNKEDIAGNFSFYPQYVKNGNTGYGAEIIKKIEPFGNTTFQWLFKLDVAESFSCMLQSGNYPQRMRCAYLKPITYSITQVPYTVEQRKNITEYTQVEKTRDVLVKQNVTQNTYTNRFFGYKQLVYFGY